MEVESSANVHVGFLDASHDYSLEDDKVDPMYKLFLEHLRRDGRSYILEMENGDNGLPVFVKYENEDSLSDVLLLDAHKSSGYTSLNKKGKYKHKKGHICKQSKPRLGEIVDFSGFHDSKTGKTLAVENYELSSGNMPHTEYGGSVKFSLYIRNQVASNLVDDSYQEFLSCLKVQDGLMVLEYNSLTLIYEGNGAFGTNENPSTEGNTCSGNQELVLYESTLSPDVAIYEADDKSIVALESCILSSFDLKLMAVLSKPYNQNEHEVLWKQANYRKPVLRHKDLRSQCKSFSTRQMGFSYLDHFPDLARKLEHSDPQQSLSLLRGLFFWLKNLCHEGAYRPWIPAGPQIVEVLDQDLMLPHEEQKVEIENLLPPLVL